MAATNPTLSPNVFHAAEVWLRDLWRVLVHEHGHRLVAKHYGLEGDVRVAPTGCGDAENCHFVGTFSYWGTPRSKSALRRIGLAGVIAEYMEADAEIGELDVADYLSAEPVGGSFSATDRKLAGDYGDRDVAATINLLRRFWPDLLRSVEDGMLYEASVVRAATAVTRG